MLRYINRGYRLCRIIVETHTYFLDFSVEESIERTKGDSHTFTK